MNKNKEKSNQKNTLKKEEEKIQKNQNAMKKMFQLVYQPKPESNVKFVQKKMLSFIVLNVLFIIVKIVKLKSILPFGKKNMKNLFPKIFLLKTKNPKKKNSNSKCPKHNQKLQFYCEKEDQLKCPVCIGNCLDQKHSLLSLNSKSDQIFHKIQIILKEIQTKEKENQLTIQKSQHNKNKFKQKIQQISQQIQKESDLLKQQIEKSKNKHLQLLKTIEIIIDNQFNQIIQKKEKTQKKINQNKTKIQKIKKLKTKNQKCVLIKESKEIINKFKKKTKKKKIKKT